MTKKAGKKKRAKPARPAQNTQDQRTKSRKKATKKKATKKKAAKKKVAKKKAPQGRPSKRVYGRPFKKGNAGKRKGTRNKVTRSMVDDVLRAYEGLGGVDYLKKLGRSRKDRRLFVLMLRRLMPHKTDLEVHAAVDWTLVLREMSDEELRRLAHATGDEKGTG